MSSLKFLYDYFTEKYPPSSEDIHKLDEQNQQLIEQLRRGLSPRDHRLLLELAANHVTGQSLVGLEYFKLGFYCVIGILRDGVRGAVQYEDLIREGLEGFNRLNKDGTDKKEETQGEE